MEKNQPFLKAFLNAFNMVFLKSTPNEKLYFSFPHAIYFAVTFHGITSGFKRLSAKNSANASQIFAQVKSVRWEG